MANVTRNVTTLGGLRGLASSKEEYDKLFMEGMKGEAIRILNLPPDATEEEIRKATMARLQSSDRSKSA
jgi:hypothetical protein